MNIRKNQSCRVTTVRSFPPKPCTDDAHSEEYQRGQLYSTAEASRNETGGGEGVEILRQEAFESDEVRPGHHLSGVYTKKIYRVRSRAPWFVRRVFPEKAFQLHEDSWNAYPYTRTRITNPGYMGSNFMIEIETLHCEDNGHQENALELPSDELDARQVTMLDISQRAHLSKDDLRNQLDPSRFSSQLTGRGPLRAGWYEKEDPSYPIMCAYKVVRIKFKWFGMQNRTEKMILHNYPRLFVKFHREVFCWMDRWHGMTMQEIRDMEEEVRRELQNRLQNGSVRGMIASE